MGNNSKSGSIFWVYIFGFLVAFSSAFTAYIDSSFVATLVPQKYVGSVFTVAYIFVIFCFLLIPYILRRLGNFITTLSLISLQLCVLLGLVFIKTPTWLIFFVIFNLTAIPLVIFLADIFLEGFSSNKRTGVIRGIYLTAVNLAWVLAQIIRGSILTDNNYQLIYLTSFSILVPLLLTLVIGLRKFNDSNYESGNVLLTLKSVLGNKNIFNIFMVNFLLSFFYAIMVIYTPIYLSKNLGFSWKEISWIFSIMLLPFVFIQLPLGYIADKALGEKELLSIGFIIMAISSGIIFFINDGSLALWATILFITRIGAATVEVMGNTYFFKKVDSINANVISYFRMSGPLAYIFGSLFGTIMLTFFISNIQGLFLILGLIMLFGVKFSLSLEDTK